MKQKNTFLKNASFLMIAALVSRVIGLVYRIPLNAIVGRTGMGYYSFAFSVYSILLLISSYSIPMAVSKVVSERLALGQYRSAHKVFKGAMIYACIVGGIAALVALFGAPYLLPQNQPNAIPALQVLTPTIFLSAILGVLRGYFQAHNTMIPTSASQIIEQILNAIVSVLAAWLLIKYLAADAVEEATWGAAGGTVGTGAGVLAGLLFMTFVYYINRGTLRRQLKRDRTGVDISYREVFRIILLMVTPVIFSTFIYNVSSYIDGYMFSSIMGRHRIDDELISATYAEFSSYYMTLINIPLSLSSASSTAVVPNISGHYARGEISKANQKIDEAVQLTMFISVPAAVGLAVLGHPIIQLFFPTTTGIAGNLLMIGAVSIVFSSLSTITNGVLQGIGKPQIPVRNAAIALVLNVVFLFCGLWFTDKLGIIAVLVATILYSVSMCILNGIYLKKYLGYKNEFRDSYGKPFLASAGMGLVAWGSYYGLYHLLPHNIVCLAVAVPLAVFTYIILFVAIVKAPEDQLRRLPAGNIIYKLAKKLRLYK